MQRLSHPHQHDVPQLRLTLLRQLVVGMNHLLHNLSRSQLPHEPHLGRRAEHAPHRTADLRADASRRPFPKVHQHGLHPTAVGEAQQVLPREAIGGLNLAAHRQLICCYGIFKSTAERRRKISHVPRRANSLAINILQQPCGMDPRKAAGI